MIWICSSRIEILICIKTTDKMRARSVQSPLKTDDTPGSCEKEAAGLPGEVNTAATEKCQQHWAGKWQPGWDIKPGEVGLLHPAPAMLVVCKHLKAAKSL